MATVVGSQLVQSEYAADTAYGLPSGTMFALGNSESSNGLNTGSIGNIFQVLPSTAANPGYGLSSVNGNDPNSVAAYLAALINGPGQGSVANGLALYQGRPIGSTGNNSIQQFLSNLGIGSGQSSSSNSNQSTTSSDFSWFDPSTWGGFVLQVGIGLLAVSFIIVGIAALALKSDPVQAANKIVKGVVK